MSTKRLQLVRLGWATLGMAVLCGTGERGASQNPPADVRGVYAGSYIASGHVKGRLILRVVKVYAPGQDGGQLFTGYFSSTPGLGRRYTFGGYLFPGSDDTQSRPISFSLWKRFTVTYHVAELAPDGGSITGTFQRDKNLRANQPPKVESGAFALTRRME